MTSSSTNKRQNVVEEIILIKTREDAETQSQIETTLQTIREASKDDVPGVVLSLSIGRIFIDKSWMDDRSMGYTHCAIARFASREDLHAYRRHESTVSVRERLEQFAVAEEGSSSSSSVVVLDWESPLAMTGESSGLDGDGAAATGVVDHVVFWKDRDGVTEEERRAFRDGALSLTDIPGVLSVTAGSVAVESGAAGQNRTGGYTSALRVRLDSKDSLRVYAEHDLHVLVKKEFLVPIMAGPPVAVDIVS